VSASERILAAYGDLSSVTPEVVGQLVTFCAELGLDPGVIADLIYYESGWRPNAVNPKSGATGLIQFMPSTAAGLGISTELIYTLDASEQMPWVAEYFRRQLAAVRSKWTGTETDHYMLVFYPAAVGNPDYAFPSKVTDVNASVTAADYARRVKEYAADRYVGPTLTGTTIARGDSRATGVILLAGLAAIVLIWRFR
jgi:hypothetical protein